MSQIQLEQTWSLGARIDGGGFGDVYEAHSAAVPSAVIKLIPKDPGAQRELLFADLSGVRNVVPVIDQGETEDHWVIVMPRATHSLKEWMSKPGQLPVDASIVLPILVDVATALADLDGRVVHRDLKPGNILMLDGSWCLADFGISRYAEATTAADTRKYFLSWEYAAPERWRLEHAEAACDVYSLGVVAYELLAGTLPFSGPTQDRFREQHLYEVPPRLTSASNLTSLVEECLLKDPRARPTPTDLLARIARGIDTPASEGHNLSDGLNRLASVQRDITARRVQADSQQARIQTEEEQRHTLADSAAQLLTRISESVASAIMAAAPAVKRSGNGTDIRLQLERVTLEVKAASRLVRRTQQSGRPVFDVVSTAFIDLTMPPRRSGCNGRGHSLWFCDAQTPGDFAWFETAFMIHPMMAPSLSGHQPFGLDLGEGAIEAVSPVSGELQVAWPFTRLDLGDLHDFIGRWAGWFADAVAGHLDVPAQMPERDPRGSWRTQ